MRARRRLRPQVAIRGLDARIRVIAAEPAGADDAARSKAAGSLQGHAPGGPQTIADGLRTTMGPNSEFEREADVRVA